MTCIVDKLEFRFWPRLVQFPGSLDRTDHVVSALHDYAGYSLELAGISEQLLVFEKALVHEVMVLDAREREREVGGAVSLIEGCVG